MASTTLKLLVPLSTAVVAGAVALGSGATWTSKSATDVSVTGGDILHETTGGVALTITKLKPGASATGTLRVTNTGDLDSLISITETVGALDEFLDVASEPDVQWLQLKIVATGGVLTAPVTIYDAPFGDLGSTGAISGVLLDAVDDEALADEYVDLEFTFRLPGDTPNELQAAVATAEYQIVTTQTTVDDEDVVDGWTTDEGSEDD